MHWFKCIRCFVDSGIDVDCVIDVDSGPEVDSTAPVLSTSNSVGSGVEVAQYNSAKNYQKWDFY